MLRHLPTADELHTGASVYNNTFDLAEKQKYITQMMENEKFVLTLRVIADSMGIPVTLQLIADLASLFLTGAVSGYFAHDIYSTSKSIVDSVTESNGSGI